MSKEIKPLPCPYCGDIVIEITDAMVRAAIQAAFASGGGTAEGIARAALEAALAAREGA